MATYTEGCSQVGSFSYAKNFTLYVVLTEKWVEIGNNRSWVDYDVYCQSSGSGSIKANHNLYFELNGDVIIDENVYVNASSPNAYISIASGTIGPIYHDNDGSKSIWFSASINATGGYGVSASCSGTFWLETIPRASTPSCITWPNTTQNVGNLGETIKIHMNRASSDFTHIVYYHWGSLSWQHIASDVGDYVSWTIPKDLANHIPNATSGTGTIVCETYNGGTHIGTKSISFTASVPNTDEFYPKITDLSISENSESKVPQDWAMYIQNQSKLNYEITANGVYSSTIRSYKAVVNGITYNTRTGVTDVLKLSGTNSIVVTATDSRGRTATLTEEFEVVAYEGIIISKLTANRCNEDGTLNEEGEFAKIDVSATIPTLNDKNTYSYNFQYKDTDEDQYTTYEVTLTEVKTDTENTISGSFIIPADGDNAFDYMLLVSDTFNPNINKVTDIGTAFQLFNWNASGRGFAMGKVSEKDAFEINMDIYTEKNIYDKSGQLVSGRKILTAYISRKNFTISQSWVNTNLAPFDYYVSNTDKLIVTDSGIVIGKGITKVLVSAYSIGINHYAFPGDVAFTICKNNERKQESYMTNINAWCSQSVPPVLLECQEGDVFSIYLTCGGTGTGELLGESLTIEIIE